MKPTNSRPEPRQRMGDYELIARVASGGMASVYLAFPCAARTPEARVAIKVLHRHWAEDPELVRMFFDEFRIAQLVRHKHVVPMVTSGISDGSPYLVMEYVEGQTLAERLTTAADEGVPLPPSIGLRVIIDMLLGLHAAHVARDEQGRPLELVHRDVSPQNMLIGMDGIGRLVDFGLARVRAADAASATAGTKGKFAYMAPEEATGEGTIDRRVDVFAAGIVLWEVLTGRRLFRSVNDAATLSSVVSGAIERPERLVPGLHRELGDVCLQALARVPSQRIETALGFAEMLEAAGASTPIASHADVARYMQGSVGQRVLQERLAAELWLFDARRVATATAKPTSLDGSRQGLRSKRASWFGALAVVGLLLLVALGFFASRRVASPSELPVDVVPSAHRAQ